MSDCYEWSIGVTVVVLLWGYLQWPLVKHGLLHSVIVCTHIYTLMCVCVSMYIYTYNVTYYVLCFLRQKVLTTLKFTHVYFIVIFILWLQKCIIIGFPIQRYHRLFSIFDSWVVCFGYLFTHVRGHTHTQPPTKFYTYILIFNEEFLCPENEITFLQKGTFCFFLVRSEKRRNRRWGSKWFTRRTVLCVSMFTPLHHGLKTVSDLFKELINFKVIRIYSSSQRTTGPPITVPGQRWRLRLFYKYKGSDEHCHVIRTV